MEGLELTEMNVHNVLDEIRPYIEADGGEGGTNCYGSNVGCLCRMCYECPDNDYGY